MIAAPNDDGLGDRPWNLNTYLWAEALQKFTPERGNATNHKPPPKLCKELITSAEKALEFHKTKSSSTGERLYEIVQLLNKYCDSINVMIQHQPTITSLVWGSFRVILLLTMDYHETSAVAIDGLEFIIKHIGRWQTEVNNWRESTRVWAAMADLYLFVLKFMSLAIGTLRTGKRMRIFKTVFADRKGKLNNALTKLKDSVSTLDSEARTAGGAFTRSKCVVIHSLIAKLDRLILHGPTFGPATAGTGEWFFCESLYQQWADSQRPLQLLVYGKAGYGKSTLAGVVIQKLIISPARPILKYFFRASSASQWEILISFASDLLSQLWSPTSCAHSRDPGPYEQEMVQTALGNRHDHKVQFDFLWTALKTSLSEITSFVLILDGIDECGSRDGVLEYITKYIHELQQLDSGRLIIFARPEPHLIQMWPIEQAITMDSSRTEADLDRIIEGRFERPNNPIAQSYLLPRIILDTVRTRVHTEADGSPLWTTLYLDHLKTALDDEELRERLLAFPATVTAVYAAQNVEECQLLTKRELAFRHALLCTILSSKRLLCPSELRSLHGLRFEKDVTRLTRPFLTVHDGFVTLTHPSVREFLVSSIVTDASHDLSQGLALKSLKILLQERFAAPSNIKRLIIRNIEELPNEDSSWGQHIGEEPSYDYSAKYWYIHVTETIDPSTDLLKTLAMFFSSAQFVHWAEYITAEDGDNTRIAHTRELFQHWPAKKFRFDATRYVVYPYREVSLSFDKMGDELLRWIALKELGNYLFLIGDTKLTWQIRQQVADALADLLGPEHALSLRALSESAYSCFLKNDMRTALVDYRYLYKTQSRISGPDKFGTLTALGYRGHAHYYLGQQKQAISSLEEAADGFGRTLGVSNIETLGRLWNIAIIHEAYGRDTEALDIFQKVLKERVKVFGGDDLFAVMVRFSVGNISRRQNRRDDTFLQLNQAYKTRITIWPKTHYLVVDAAIARSVAFWHFGMRQEGLAQLDDIELDEDLMSRCQRYCQCRHLRALLSIQGTDTQKAIDILRLLSQDCEREQYNRALLWSKLDLALLLRRRGEEDEAAALFHNLVRDPEQDPGDDEPDPPRFLDISERALRLTRKGAIKQADEILRSAKLEWAREEDLWFWVGGPRPDTEIMPEP